MISIEHVRKRFGSFTAVEDVSLLLETGESVALWGANGAGKSTLIRCVLGLLRYEGRISVGGLDAASNGKRSRGLIGYVPQELGFHDEMRTAEAVRFFSRLKGDSGCDADAVLGGVGLEGHGRKRIGDLSGGMKQRLALAIALIGDPPVLVLDEVTASLDACGRDEFVDLLRTKAGGGGERARTLLFASHRAEEIEALAHRVVVMQGGRVVAERSPRELASECSAPGLRIRLAAALRESAASVLRAGGYEPLTCGIGVTVRVTAGAKAAPLGLLAEARIPVDDFDLVAAQTENGTIGGGR